MSGGGGAISLGQFGRGGTPPPAGPPRQFVERFTPSQGWVALILLLVTLLTVVESVSAADWVETPGLARVLLLGAIAGLLLAKVKAPAPLLLLAGLCIGFVVVVWQVSSLAEGQDLGDRVGEFGTRMDLWYEAATSGGISTDLIPFSLALVAFSWVLGFLCAWFTFRRSNIWAPVVLAGIAILTNLSFLPDRFGNRFFFFIFFAMLLVVWMSTVQQRQAWLKSGVKFTTTGSWLTLHSAVWFGILVIVLAALLPLKSPVYGPIKDLWNLGRTPVAGMEDEFGRLFGAVPSRKGIIGRFFGDTLPFLGKVSLSNKVAFWASTDIPSYWTSRTYSEYTSRGWIAGKTTALDMGPDMLPPSLGDSLRRVPVPQSVQFTFESSDFLTGGNLDWVSRNAVAETLAPLQFEIDLKDAAKDHLFPEDVRQLAQRLREGIDSLSGGFVESNISRVLPDDLVLLSVTQGGGGAERPVPEKVILERKAPPSPEIVSWEFTDNVNAREQYDIVSLVSVATAYDLAKAGTDYSGFIKDHYLQLPDSLPDRVAALAQEITRGAETPLDKALAVQSYLRGPEFTYSKKISMPPRDADGIDHFLFETKTGYSDYFGSSMAVLLRAVGVPSRMAVGYAPGERDDQSGLRYIRGADSHGWTQVYFPDYGWIDFEPTPNWPALEHQPAPGAGEGTGPDMSEELLNAQFLDAPVDPSEMEGAEGSLDGTAGGPVFDAIGLLVWLAGVIGSIALGWSVWTMVWNRGLGKVSPAERLYTKMNRLGAMAGIGRPAHQTPHEYAAALGEAVPAVSAGARRIGWAFAGDRYGRRQPDPAELSALDQAWRSIRGRLAVRAIRRFIPVRGKS